MRIIEELYAVGPALGYLASKLQLFWTTGADIRMQEMDISTVSAPKLVGSVTVIAARLGASGVIHSPTPVYGPDGDVEGLWLAESLGTDMYYKPLEGSIPIQGLSSQLGVPAPGKFVFTNTAHIVIK